MKQNITLSVDKPLLQRARVAAARRGLSVSALLSDELRGLIEREEAYRQAMAKALADLTNPPALGNARIRKREALHDRKDLRR